MIMIISGLVIKIGYVIDRLYKLHHKLFAFYEKLCGVFEAARNFPKFCHLACWVGYYKQAYYIKY